MLNKFDQWNKRGILSQQRQLLKFKPINREIYMESISSPKAL